MKPMKFFDPPPVRYLGSKWQLADWLVAQFPPHELYCEPFAGSAAVFFRKYPSAIEVLNDVDGEVVNFFRVLRSQPEDLVNAIDLTPWSRAEYDLSYEPCDDPLERARRFYVRSRQSFCGYTARKSGWRTIKKLKAARDITGEWRRLDGLLMAADRLKDALVECLDACTVIARYDHDKALFYVDPPYVKRSRSDSGTSRYPHEMTDDDHAALAKVLHQIEGMALVSGYDSELYRELYSDWQVISKTTTTNGNSKAVEYLWISRKAADIARLPLFDPSTRVST